MSKNLEKMFLENQILRYSEQKFMQDYEEAKEVKQFLTELSEEDDYISEEF